MRNRHVQCNTRKHGLRKREPNSSDCVYEAFKKQRVLTSYHAYSDWEDLMRFMMRGLEIAYDSG